MFPLRASSRLRHHKSKHLDARDSNTPLWYAVPAVTATEELTYSKESPGLGCWNQNRVTLNRNAFDDVAGDFAVASVIEAGGSGVGVAGERRAQLFQHFVDLYEAWGRPDALQNAREVMGTAEV